MFIVRIPHIVKFFFWMWDRCLCIYFIHIHWTIREIKTFMFTVSLGQVISCKSLPFILVYLLYTKKKQVNFGDRSLFYLYLRARYLRCWNYHVTIYTWSPVWCLVLLTAALLWFVLGSLTWTRLLGCSGETMFLLGWGVISFFREHIGLCIIICIDVLVCMQI